jgi:hypothetical protein
MFTDINVSSDLNAQFNDSLQKEGCELGIGFAVNVLQVTYAASTCLRMKITNLTFRLQHGPSTM